MQIKRFEARNMTEALRLIKQEFGSEAVILSARTIKREKGILGVLKKQGVEVTAATDSYLSRGENADYSNKTKTYDNEPAGSDFENLNAKKRLTNSHSWGIQESKYGRHSRAGIRNPFAQNDSKEFFTFYQRMIAHGIDEDTALRLLRKVNRAALLKGLPKGDNFVTFLIPVLEKMGMETGRIKINRRKQKIAAFIGPTGVGKTTTVAKMAAGARSLRRKNGLALITLDSYRIGGITQLKAYAQIMGIPIEVASNNKELRESIEILRNNHLILIDTAGIPQRNGYQINELKNFFVGIHPVEFHLLLSAGTKEEDLRDILEKFEVIPISSLIFTKLDESTTYGNIFNLLLRSKIPVSYFTNGQQIPEDIEVATLEKLVDLILDDEKVVERWSVLPETSSENSMNFEQMLETASGEQKFKALKSARTRHA
jgi:flagellar biosynthesis protein FlhF